MKILLMLNAVKTKGPRSKKAPMRKKMKRKKQKRRAEKPTQKMRTRLSSF